MTNPIKGLVFDKDGCLFDFNATWGAFTRALLISQTQDAPERLAPLADALGYDLDSATFRKSSLVIAGTVDEVIAATLPYVTETDPAALRARFKTAAATAPQIEVTPLKPLFTRLRGAGFKLGLATNDAEGPARANLASAGIEGLFDFIAGYDSGFGGKPEPGQLHGFCAATNLDPQDCVMIGDSTHDLHAGRAAGMTCVGVLTGIADRADLTPHADIVLASIAALPAWLGLPE